MFSMGMSADTVDENVQEWERIGEAVAFRYSESGDEVLIARKVPCPDCGKTYVMGLANGDTVSYARRHAQCAVNNTMGQLEDGVQDNG
jgi:hypothetical protein